MKYNLLGNTGLKVSKFCLSTMIFGGQGYLDQQSADDQIKTALNAGPNGNGLTRKHILYEVEQSLMHLHFDFQWIPIRSRE